MRTVGARWVIEDAPRWVRIPVVTVFYIVAYAILVAPVFLWFWVFLVLFAGVDGGD